MVGGWSNKGTRLSWASGSRSKSKPGSRSATHLERLCVRRTTAMRRGRSAPCLARLAYVPFRCGKPDQRRRGDPGYGRPREPYTRAAATGARLAEFSQVAGMAVANAKSRSYLAESRARIVRARDAARRRFERDLHDGAQQRLVSLGSSCTPRRRPCLPIWVIFGASPPRRTGAQRRAR